MIIKLESKHIDRTDNTLYHVLHNCKSNEIRVISDDHPDILEDSEDEFIVLTNGKDECNYFALGMITANAELIFIEENND